MHSVTTVSRPSIKWGTLFELLFLACSLCMFLIAGKNPVVTSFATVFSGIVLEALPFMLLGSLAGGLIEVYISRDRLISRLPAKTWQTVQHSNKNVSSLWSTVRLYLPDKVQQIEVTT